jgi:hypothetical protein
LEKQTFSPQGSPYYMPNPFRRSVSLPAGPLLPALLLCLLSLTPLKALSQTSTPLPAGLSKQLDRIDLAISAAGILSTTVSGTQQRDQTKLTIDPSGSVGEVATLRYTAKPYVGFEFNFGNSRYNQNFIFAPPAPNYLPGGAQNNVHELTLGYVAHPHPFFGFHPFLGAGGGTMQFRPTPGGGQGLPRQFRAAYYYDLGAEHYFPTSDHFGMRVAFRQLIYLAPDFGQNYLTITRRTRTSEPTIGFFARF